MYWDFTAEGNMNTFMSRYICKYINLVFEFLIAITLSLLLGLFYLSCYREKKSDISYLKYHPVFKYSDPFKGSPVSHSLSVSCTL